MISISSSRFWTAVIAVPILVNGLLGMFVVAPLEMRLRTLRSAQAAAEVRPRLESLLKESHKILSDSERTGFSEEGSLAVTSALPQLAGRHHVEIEVRVKDREGLSSSPSTLPLEVEVTGPFNKLGRWLGDLERYSGFQINSWKMTPGKEPADPPRWTADITAFS